MHWLSHRYCTPVIDENLLDPCNDMGNLTELGITARVSSQRGGTQPGPYSARVA